MKILIDTHILIWVLTDEKQKLSSLEIEAIENTENQVFVSIVSLWEIGIKNSLGRLNLKRNLDLFFELVAKTDFQVLPISEKEIIQMSQLPFHHNDPFDRLILGQAIAYKLTLISKDAAFRKYDVNFL